MGRKTFCLNRDITKYTRGEASNIIGKIWRKTTRNSIKKTDYVLAGEEAGSQRTKSPKLRNYYNR